MLDEPQPGTDLATDSRLYEAASGRAGSPRGGLRRPFAVFAAAAEHSITPEDGMMAIHSTATSDTKEARNPLRPRCARGRQGWHPGLGSWL